MKLILAMFRPEKLPEVKKALYKEKVHMMTVLDVRGCGQQEGFTETYRGVIEQVTLHRKVMLLIAVNESFVKSTMKTIQESARTNGGKIGDGKIFVLPLEQALRIRTGESGPKAMGGEAKEMKKTK